MDLDLASRTPVDVGLVLRASIGGRVDLRDAHTPKLNPGGFRFFIKIRFFCVF